MVKSHVTAPAVYLKNFRIKRGQFKSNSDSLYVYDKLKDRYDYKKNTRGKWIEEINFFTNEVEKFNSKF